MVFAKANSQQGNRIQLGERQLGKRSKGKNQVGTYQPLPPGESIMQWLFLGNASTEKKSTGHNYDRPKICLQGTIFAVFEGWQSSINILAVGEAQASSEAAHDIPQADELKAA